MADENADVEDRTTSVGLARYSYEYIEAALVVDEHIGAKPGFEIVAPIPALYLMGHGIELILKSYLRHRGISVRELASNKYGHDLHACYRKAKELGLHDLIHLHVAEEGALELLNALYKTKELEYIKTGAKQFPSFGLVERVAIRLFNSVSRHVGFPHVFHIAFHGDP